MLNHESPEEANSESPASHNRVTPDELARAIAAIEARKQVEADRLAGTIPIDEAVTSLHLNASSDEIWAEVQAQRGGAARLRQSAQDEANRRVQAPQTSPFWSAKPMTWRGQRKPRRGLIGVAIAFGILYVTGVIPHYHFTPTRVVIPLLRPLSQVPDGTEVHADTTALIQISEGKPLSQIVVDQNESSPNAWNLVKTSGHVYLRGYIASQNSLQSVQGKPLNIYSDDNSGELEGERTSNITLRVDKTPLQKSAGDSDFSAVTVPNFQPDPLTTLTPWR